MSNKRADAGSARISISSEIILCQICFTDIANESLNGRQQHYEHHFLNKLDGGLEVESPPSGGTFKKSMEPLKKILASHVEEPFWYSALPTPPPPNYTPGMVQVLSQALRKSIESGGTRHAVLCHERAVYISRENWDASWGCGYRNFLMACATLMDQQLQPLYFPLLDVPIPPGVRNLQRWIEHAWKEGFDTQGHQDLGHLVNTRKWVGTSDIWVAFASRGVPAELVDFDLRKSSTGIQPLVNWVVAYFSLPHLSQIKGLDLSALVTDRTVPGSVTITDRMPLILQHAGHSRTIVGYEALQDGTINLLTFDPSKLPGKKIRTAGLSLANYHFRTVLPHAFSTCGTAPNPRKPIGRAGGSSSKSSLKNSSPSKHRSLLDFFHSVPSHKRKPSLDSPSNNQKRTRVDTTLDNFVISTPRPRQKLAGSTERDTIELTDESDDEGVSTVPSSRDSDTRDTPKEPDIWSDGLLPFQVLNLFRLEPNLLEKKKQYQILYFPMNAPLTVQERMQRKVIRSTRAC